jgi:hypothetical protein
MADTVAAVIEGADLIISTEESCMWRLRCSTRVWSRLIDLCDGPALVAHRLNACRAVGCVIQFAHERNRH